MADDNKQASLLEATEAVKAMKTQQDAFIAEQKKATEDLQKKLSESEEKVKKLETDAKANQSVIDNLQAKAKDIPLNGGHVKSFSDLLEDGLTAKKDNLTKYKNGEGKGFVIEMARKAVGIMASATSLTGSYFVSPTVVPGVVKKLFEEVHLRDWLPVGQTNSNTVRFIQDNGGEGGPTTVAEGAAKPMIDRDLEIKDAPVRKIATHFRVPEEMIEDIPYLSSFLTEIGLEEVQVVEDNQILYGDGTGQNLTGFNTAGTAFAAGTSVIGASANEFDVIGAAKKQIRMNRINGPYVAMISPLNYYDMRYKRKDSTNNYIFQAPSLNPLNAPLQADGVQIIENTAVTAGDFFVFSPRAAMIFDRTGTNARFYDQDQDNAIKNLITIVIEKRLALPIYRPLGIVKGTFTAAITDLTS